MCVQFIHMVSIDVLAGVGAPPLNMHSNYIAATHNITLHAHQNALHTHHYPPHCLPQPFSAHNQQTKSISVQVAAKWHKM